MINAKITDIPVPVTRTEHFMYSAITGNESGLKADTQAEMYLEAIKDGDVSDLEGLEPRTVLDMYLEARQTGVVDDLPKPRTTSEMLLYQAITGEDLGAKPVSNMDKYLSLLEPNNYDARIEIESESSTIKLTDSKNGVVEIKELEGNTLVNEIKFGFKDTVSTPPYVRFTQIRGLKPNTTYTAITPYFDSSIVQMYIGYSGGQGIVAYQNSNVVKFTTGGTIHTNEILFYYRGTGSPSFVSTLPTTHVILEGDWTNKEIPQYFEGMKSVGECEDNKIEIKTTGKNKIKLKDTTISTIDGLTVSIKDNVFTINGTSKSDIRIKLTNSYDVCYGSNYETRFPIWGKEIVDFVKIGKTYANSWTYLDGKNLGVLFAMKDKDGVTLEITESGSGARIYKNVNRNVAFVQIYIPAKTYTSHKVSLQIEDGGQATSHEPYKENSIELSLQEPLRGLPNGVRDRIVLKDGRLMIERNTGQILLNGDNNEKWVFESNWTDSLGELSRFLISVPNQKNILWHDLIRESKNYSINNRFNALENIAETFALEIEHFTGWDFGKFVLNIKTSRLSIKNELGLKQWLSENPIELAYELKTPTYEEISPQLSKLILRCYDNATLYFNTNIPPKSLISYTANTSNIYKYLDTLKLSKEECDSIINSMERV